MLAAIGGGRVALRTRNGADCSGWYPEVTAGLVSVGEQHLLDGEVCVLDELGRADFNRLQDRSQALLVGRV